MPPNQVGDQDSAENNPTAMKKPTHTLRPWRGNEKGLSLILVLTLIVLVTFASVAFFSRTAANSSIENARVGQIYTAQLSESGVDHVLSLFLSEISSNSVTLTNGASRNYFPSSNAAMVPSRSMAQAAMLTNAAFANLVRQSVAGTADPAVSTHSSGAPSRDGRVVDANRWNAPCLVNGGFGSTNQLPSWVYVNGDGTLTNVPSANTIGRFAYNTYDIGGLLDANAAGCPSGSTVAQMSVLKGTQAGADLTRIPGVTLAAEDALISFRNPQATNAAAYADYVPGAAANGWLTAVVTNASGSGSTTNTFFASRQDLIRYAQNQNTPLTNALPYLTHFSRELARPSLTNNGLLAMTSRYDLSRIAVATNVGLTGSAPTYSYTSTLSSNLASTNPDLFQVLSAAITYTNSWENTGPTNVFSSVSWPTNAALKAVALGANIIDQFTTNSTPVRITYASQTVAGKKQLPYVSRIFLVYNTYIQIQSSGNNNNNKNTNNNSGSNTNWMNGKAVGNPGTGNNGNDKDRGNTGGGNTFWITFSVIPQVYSPTGATVNMTARLDSGALVLGAGTLSNFSNTVVTLSTNVSVGCTPINAQSFNGNSAAMGFLSTSYGFQGSITNSPLSVSLQGLSFALGDGSGAVYSNFGTNSAAASNGVVSAPLSFTVTLTNISSTTTDSGSLALDGVEILTIDPRTIRGAGETNRMPSGGDTNSLYANIVSLTNNYAPANITDTNWISPTNRISSVGELGSVFRESPWRSVDFVSSNSADRNLLDVFSAYSTPANGIRAGVVNLNTRQPVVLAALLAGTPTTGSGTITPTSATTYASNMVAATAASPLVNRTQLVNLVSSNVIASAGDLIKQSREAAIRSLGEVGQTRTWNVLIDVVAQNGKFTGGGTGSADFSVAGERRVWVSVAIDRITGRIIDRQTEQVSE